MVAPIVYGIGVGALKLGHIGYKLYKARKQIKRAKELKELKDKADQLKRAKEAADKLKKAKEAADKAAKAKKKCAGNCGRKIDFDEKQLQRKYKHAKDFGVDGPYSKANGTKFKDALNGHVNNPGTNVIQGTYRGDPVAHFFNPQTGLNVMRGPSGNFLSGWKLNSGQIANITSRGAL